MPTGAHVSPSPAIQVKNDHQETVKVVLFVLSGAKCGLSIYYLYPRKYVVKTPSRSKSIKLITRKNYVSLTAGVVNSLSTSKTLVTQFAVKIKSEMKDQSSDSTDSILRDSIEAVKKFSLETVWLELSRKVPTLMSLLSHIVDRPMERVPLLCLIASQLVK